MEPNMEQAIEPSLAPVSSVAAKEPLETVQQAPSLVLDQHPIAPLSLQDEPPATRRAPFGAHTPAPVISSTRHVSVDATSLDTLLSARDFCYSAHEPSAQGDFPLLAHIVEHPLGYTMRLDRIEYQGASSPPDPSTVLGAMLPNSHRAMWTLPKLDWIDVSLYPCICIEYSGRIFTVAIIHQTQQLARGYFSTLGLLATPPREPPADALELDPIQYAFFSELFKTEWNPDVTLFGELIDPIASLVAAKFRTLHNMPPPLFPIVAYHGTLGINASFILSHGFDAPSACSRASDAVCPFKCSESVCRCRMLGPGVYGTTFGRALAFASTRHARGVSETAKFAQDPTDVGVVRFAVTVQSVSRKSNDFCACGCGQRFVDHSGLWRRSSDCVLLPANSEPASKYMEIAVANPKHCLVLSAGKWQRRYAKAVAQEPSLAQWYDASIHQDHTLRSHRPRPHNGNDRPHNGNDRHRRPGEEDREYRESTRDYPRPPYQERSRSRHQDGARQGYQDGARQGYQEGARPSYQDGARQPYQERQRQGYQDGARPPYQERSRQGYQDGARQGYQDGARPRAGKRPHYDVHVQEFVPTTQRTSGPLSHLSIDSRHPSHF